MDRVEFESISTPASASSRNHPHFAAKPTLLMEAMAG